MTSHLSSLSFLDLCVGSCHVDVRDFRSNCDKCLSLACAVFSGRLKGVIFRCVDVVESILFFCDRRRPPCDVLGLLLEVLLLLLLLLSLLLLSGIILLPFLLVDPAVLGRLRRPFIVFFLSLVFKLILSGSSSRRERTFSYSSRGEELPCSLLILASPSPSPSSGTSPTCNFFLTKNSFSKNISLYVDGTALNAVASH